LRVKSGPISFITSGGVVYDMLAQWQHDQIARPGDQVTEKYLGASPMQNRRVYFDSSPMSYATTDRTRARFLLIHGTADDVVDPTTQSQTFQNALSQAGIYVRRFGIPGAGHFWASDRSKARSGATGRPSRRRSLGFWRPRFRLRHAVDGSAAATRREGRRSPTGDIRPRVADAGALILIGVGSKRSYEKQ
jgi:acetyl esterase/lipase